MEKSKIKNIKISCKITNCIIGNNVKIGDNCSISDCVIPDNTIVEPKSELSNCTVNE